MIKQGRNKNLFGLFEPIIIVVFWLVLFMSPIFLSESEYDLNWDHVFRMWLSFTPYLILFLINRYVLLPYLFFRNRRLLFLGSALFIIIIMAFGVFHFRRKVFRQPVRFERSEQFHSPPQKFREPPSKSDPNQPQVRNQNPPPQRPPRELPPYIAFVIVSTLIIGFDTGLRLSVKWVRSEQTRTFVEKENMQTQLAFLRNQVSPHFFMNTLNNIHSLIDFDTTEAKESIIRLSKLMRHLLYDSEAEKIPMKKEVDFIRSYVDLMRLRYSDQANIELRLPTLIPEISIPPLLFTSFVENAFKHGASKQASMSIVISFLFEDEKLQFQIRNNHAQNSQANDHVGIGIANSKKRLDLLYGDSYKLNIEDRENEFIVNLIIPV